MIVLHGFEGRMYVGPAGAVPKPNTQGTVELVHIREPKYGFKYSETDAAMRKHRGVKTYAKGSLDVSIEFTLENVKIESEDGKAFSRPEDVQMILNALKSRHSPLAFLMLDDIGGEGIFGDFEVFSGDKTETDDDIQSWAISCKPSVEGSGVGMYPDDATP